MAQESRVPRDTRGVIDEQRDIQREVKKADEQNNAKGGGAMQAGARAYPEPPFPKQHQPKPGLERALDPKPMYDAPFYKGSEKLKDKVAIITGAGQGLGRAVALEMAAEGAV